MSRIQNNFSFNREYIAKRIKEACAERGIRANELSIKANLKSHDIYNFIHMKSTNIAKLETIAKVLGKDLSYFDINNDQNTRTRETAPQEFDYEIYTKILKYIREVMIEKKIDLSKQVVDQIVDAVYPDAHRSGKVEKKFIEGAVLLASKSSVES